MSLSGSSDGPVCSDPIDAESLFYKFLSESLGGSDFLSYLCSREWIIVLVRTLRQSKKDPLWQKKRYAPNLRVKT